VRGWAAWTAAAGALGCCSACLSDRPRPAPPQVAITLDATQVHSPDILSGTLFATDPDGLDSVWLAVGDAPPIGEDGLLEPRFQSPFRVPIAAGHNPGDRVPITLRARDVEGFVGSLDTVVTVVL
jgi:hypothetical protein